MKRREFMQLAATGAGSALLGATAGPVAGGLRPAGSSGRPVRPARGASDVVVIGAGAFGGWSAYHLSKRGVAVTLVDAYGPGNSRASSGGETRLTQVDYGERTIYIRMALRAYVHWIELQERSGERLVLPTGRLAMYPDAAHLDEVRKKVNALPEFGVTDTEILDASEIRSRWPQIRTDDIAFAMYNPGGAGGSTLMARKASRVVAAEFEREGGEFRVSRVRPVTGRVDGVQLANGDTLVAQHYVFACGPWLRKLFPGLLGRRLQVQRRDVFFHGVPPGDPRFSHPNLPEWSVQGTGWYGFPDIDHRGLKSAPYPDLNTLDPDTDERLVTPQQVKRARDFIGHRFPALDGQPITESRVCQVTNSVDGHFIVDRHPDAENVWIVGGGSGHGFKHGPALGEYVAQRVLGEPPDAEYDATFRLKSDEPF